MSGAGEGALDVPLLETDAEEGRRRRYGLFNLSRIERISASRTSGSEASVFQRLA
jgi:hypothetical protein